MSELNITELKNIPPEKRIEELKKLLAKFAKKKDKKVVEIINELIDETQKEIVALEKLIVKEGKKIVREEKEEQKEGATLEERARIEKQDEQLQQLTKQKLNTAYSLSRKPIEDLYNKLSDIYKDTKAGEATPEQQEYTQILKVALYKKEKDSKEGRYNPDEDARLKMGQAERIVKYLKGEIGEERKYDY